MCVCVCVCFGVCIKAEKVQHFRNAEMMLGCCVYGHTYAYMNVCMHTVWSRIRTHICIHECMYAYSMVTYTDTHMHIYIHTVWATRMQSAYVDPYIYKYMRTYIQYGHENAD